MTILLLMGALISVGASIPYILAVVKGGVRPRVVSWGIWAVLAAIMTVSGYLGGAVVSVVMSSITFIACSAIAILGWRQRSGHISHVDIVCVVGAALGVASLAIFNKPLIAMAVSVLVGVIAFIPTLIHAWTKPYEESLVYFALSGLAGTAAFLVALSANGLLVAILYPMYSMVFNTLAALFIVGGRSRLVPARGNYATES